MSFHSLQSLSVSYFHILGFLGPRFPSTCLSQAVLTAPLESSTCPYHGSLLSFRMRSRSSMPGRASSSLDLMVTMSCSLTLQMSDHCPVIPLQTLEVCLCQWPSLTGMEHLVFTLVVVESSQPPAANRACLLSSKWRLPPLACQVRLGLPSVVCRLGGMQFPGTVYICSQGPL